MPKNDSLNGTTLPLRKIRQRESAVPKHRYGRYQIADIINKVIVEENDDSYVIDFQRGLGEVSYSKKDWTLTRALYHQSIQNYKKEIEEDLYEW